MFWGITLDGGKRYSQTVERPFHLSMAALECSSIAERDKARQVQVMIQHESAEFLLCTLCPFSLLQQQLDLTFSQGEEITLFLNGTGVVHLTGSLMEEETVPFEDDFEGDLDIPQLQKFDDSETDGENGDVNSRSPGIKRKANEANQKKRKKSKVIEKGNRFDHRSPDLQNKKGDSLVTPDVEQQKKKKKKKQKKHGDYTGNKEIKPTC